MNVIHPSSPTSATDRTLVASQENLGRSLNRLSAGAGIGLPETANPRAVAVSERFDAHGKRVQSALTEVQQSASAVQTADHFLGSLTDLLTKMNALTSRNGDQTPSSEVTPDGAQPFQALQLQLRVTLVGTRVSGGVSSTQAPAVAFDGTELFSPEDQPNPPAASANPGVLPKFRLRSGALSSLIQQDRSGNFSLGASDSTAGDVVKSALQDVGDARTTVRAAGDRLQLEAITLRIESENLTSALTPIRDEAASGEFTRAATASILLQPGAALLGQGNVNPQGTLQVLER